MDFKQFKNLFQKNLNQMFENNSTLFIVDVDKDQLWNTYLDSFPHGTNEIFRERREYDCSCCRQFIKAFGNVVVIENNEPVSIWGFTTADDTFQPVIDVMADLVESSKIRDVFITKELFFGTNANHEKLENGSVLTWDHFYTKVPEKFIAMSNKTIGSIMGDLRSTKEVFRRSLDEISEEAIDSVLDLIRQNSLYKGEEWKAALIKFKGFHTDYHKLTYDAEKDAYCWLNSITAGGAIGKIKNHSIGVLLVDITGEMDLDKAVGRYEKIVAPTNYKRPKAIFTKKMLNQAQMKVAELGLLDSLGRRHAAIEDITVNNILFANKDAVKKMSGDVFAEMGNEIITTDKQFERVEEIPIERFVKDILPTTTNIEAWVENRHTADMMSLIAPQVKGCPSLFKWDNGFSWAYNGNITDSMKQRVKAAGGNVDGVLRFSLQWSDEKHNPNDFDAHCVEPNGNHIWYSNVGREHPSTGILDVDIQNPKENQVAVENITWAVANKMQEGEYLFFVHNYSHNGGRSGFTAEIEYDGQIHSFEYPKELRRDENVIVAKIQFNRKTGIKFIKSLPSSLSSKTIWGLQTNQFHPVSVCMFSPNYWDGQIGIGHKHYFFMIDACRNEEQPNGFFNEFLKEDFAPHKRVFEALGSKMRVEQSENQLSGLGFSSTKRNSVILKLKGSFTRTVKIIF